MSRVLLVGAEGQLGRRLQRELTPEHTLVPFGRSELDLERTDRVHRILDQQTYYILINTAAHTQVDAAETNAEPVLRVNAVAPGLLATHARQRGARFIHCSTDYVFDGAAKRPYVEEDPARPVNIYGQSKAQGDEAVMKAGGDFWILRFGWVYGMTGINFLQTMRRLLKGLSPVNVVNDQWGTPTWTGTIARTLAHMLRVGHGAPSGTYHVAPTGISTWCTFAEAIRLQMVQQMEGSAVETGAQALQMINPITTAQFLTSARRPAYTVLDTSRLCRTFDLSMPSWRTELAACFAEHDVACDNPGERIHER